MAQLTQEEITKIQEIIKDLPPEEQEQKARELVAQLYPEVVKQQCPFCFMAEGKIPTTKVHEDNNFLAVLEINPANPGHTLLFPKKHIQELTELNDQETASLFVIAQNITKALAKIAEGTNLYVANGIVAGQKFDHGVIHIIPRYKNDTVTFSWQPQRAKADDLKTIQEHITKNMPKGEKKQEEQKEVVINTDYFDTEFRRP